MATTTRTERRILGGAVRRIRVLSKITQDALAQAVDRHPAYISNIERGERQPSLETMAALANALGVGIDDITYLTSIVVIEAPDSAAA